MTPDQQEKWDKLEVGKQKALEVRAQAIELSKVLGFKAKGRRAKREAELWIMTAKIEQRKLQDAQ